MGIFHEWSVSPMLEDLQLALMGSNNPNVEIDQEMIDQMRPQRSIADDIEKCRKTRIKSEVYMHFTLTEQMRNELKKSQKDKFLFDEPSRGKQTGK
jgi:hypothetical protein